MSGVAITRLEFHEAALDALDQVLGADHIGPGGGGLGGLGVLGDHLRRRASRRGRCRSGRGDGQPRTFWSAWRGSTPRLTAILDALIELWRWRWPSPA